ncbi:hypothetical protein [Hymenobacter negativus]|uniref:Uncharacterized protein n=1 Tax=Hymenobacter negativus TaxID=2795026 RepID=A0ABS3QI30_9BACT|nr:hypothetical protein [Hymenobacter negativus]MBO2010907.1 hypothetical protein [Hymenobacter negativus]
MRTLLLPALLLTFVAGPALAQVPRRTTTAPVPQTTGLPAQSGAVPAAAVPGYHNGYTNKHLGGTTSPTFPNGLPERNLDNGTSAADQPRANQSQAGARPTRSLNSRKQR